MACKGTPSPTLRVTVGQSCATLRDHSCDVDQVSEQDVDWKTSQPPPLKLDLIREGLELVVKDREFTIKVQPASA